jgi:hypothetical protein
MGLAVIEPDCSDSRRRLLGGTPKLQQVVQEYKQRLARLGEDN